MQIPTALDLQVPMPSNMITQEEKPVPLKNDQVLRRACSDVVAEADKLVTGFDMSLSLKINNNEVEMVECECCGLCEECTPTYIMSIKDSFSGKWICGLCSEALKEKMKQNPGLTIDGALENHGAFCKQFNRTIRINPKLSLAGAMRDIARRSSQNRYSTKVFCESKIAITMSCAKVQRSSFQYI